jgi:hypothetical protein
VTDAERLRERVCEDVLYLHEDAAPPLPPAEISRALDVPYWHVLDVLTEYYAGRRAYADAVRLAELPPHRRRLVTVEAGSAHRTTWCGSMSGALKDIAQPGDRARRAA